MVLAMSSLGRDTTAKGDWKELLAGGRAYSFDEDSKRAGCRRDKNVHTRSSRATEFQRRTALRELQTRLS